MCGEWRSGQSAGRGAWGSSVWSSVRSAVITGNRFRYGESLVNHAQGTVRLSDNVTDDYDLRDERK